MDNFDGWFGVYVIAGIVRRDIAVLLDSMSLSCCASVDALIPRVLKFCIASSPTVAKPRTTTSTTTKFAGFLDVTTCEAQGTDGRCRSG